MEQIRISEEASWRSIYTATVMVMNRTGPVEMVARSKQVGKALFVAAKLRGDGLLDEKRTTISFPTLERMQDGNEVVDVSMVLFPDERRIQEKAAYLNSISEKEPEELDSRRDE